MKKMTVLIALFIGMNPLIFSLEESWISLGTNFGNYFENGTDLKNTYIGYARLNFNGYGFWNKKI
jgi:hypothetical protein